MNPMNCQWYCPMEIRVCNFWCVICCPDTFNVEEQALPLGLRTLKGHLEARMSQDPRTRDPRPETAPLLYLRGLAPPPRAPRGMTAPLAMMLRVPLWSSARYVCSNTETERACNSCLPPCPEQSFALRLGVWLKESRMRSAIDRIQNTTPHLRLKREPRDSGRTTNLG